MPTPEELAFAAALEALLKGDKGDKGDVGDVGPKGDTGNTGTKGDKGDTGDTGIKGDIGLKGDKGDKGEKGDKGDTGTTGAVGPAGMGSAVPGGRLTIVSGKPEMPQNAAYTSTTLWLAPHKGNTVAVFNGTEWVSLKISASATDTVGLSMQGGAKWVAGTQRDSFVAGPGGVAVLGTGPAWPSATPTEAARGLALLDGIWVNAAEMALDTSPTTQITVPAYQARFRGSIDTPVAGVISADFTQGQNRYCGVSNLDNQVLLRIYVGSPAPTTSPYIRLYPVTNQYYANGASNWVAYNNDINNSGYSFCCMPQDVSIRYHQRGFLNTVSGLCACLSTICKNAVSNPVGTYGSCSSDVTGVALGNSAVAVHTDRASLGRQRFIMANGTANQGVYGSGGVATLWSMNNIPGRAPDDAQGMWIEYWG
jgi:hypothetical protein